MDHQQQRGKPVMFLGSTSAAIIALLCLEFGSAAGFATAANAAATETVVYSFQNNAKDGYFPTTALTNVGGTLYGTTGNGGIGRCSNGCGTIFSIDPATGVETVLYSFRGKYPENPQASGLLGVGNKLYGTTLEGGRRGDGTLFSLDTKTGDFTTLYSFCALYECTDGAGPTDGLLDWKGVLYGTMSDGGSTNNEGTAFAFDTKTGLETTVYTFCGDIGCKDGGDPEGGLARIKGKIYGLAQYGGGKQCLSCGLAFQIDPARQHESVAYSFCHRVKCADGYKPRGALLESNGLLYGVTQFGGQDTCNESVYGCGTVFSLNPATDTETVLYAFQSNGTYVTEPTTGLVDLNGMLYGTSSSGGAYGKGAVYSVDPASGAESIVYSFCSLSGCTDGSSPAASLISVNDTLYGTTSTGGTGNCLDIGCGTVFAITP
jgi:uncharacterized repeat protein (TIGR03803 family)